VAQQAGCSISTARKLQLVLQQRAQYEHAIAALTGNPLRPSACGCAIEQRSAGDSYRRSLGDSAAAADVAASERQMAYENAQVGLAMAAFYPHITLSGVAGGKAGTLPR